MIMTDKNKYIEDLLNRFLEGETSTEEEKELYAFFKSGDLPEHLVKYRAAFDYFENELSEELEKEAIEDISLIRKSLTKRLKLSITMAAAAVLVVILSLPLFVGEKDISPYENSYMVKNGVVSYNTDEIEVELQKVEQTIAQKEKEIGEMMWAAQKTEIEIYELEQKARDIEEQYF